MNTCILLAGVALVAAIIAVIISGAWLTKLGYRHTDGP